MEKIKLVVWDLDETFWKGTLSEGKVEILQENIEIVKELARRGIVSSISSKNDFEDAKKKLIEAGIWDYFIFPSISWSPKGKGVKHLIEACQLRSPNVLFIDDNISNRKEVEHYNPGINTCNETQIADLLTLPELKGKDDSELSRLKQYKILEEKAKVKESFSDNHAFLIESDIRIHFMTDVKDHRDRILELISRTNQLNFTKIRLDEKDVDELLNNPEMENVCIHVEDKFGDYGICGFYTLHKKTKCLKHFLFSCRILNLGIEAYVYQKLGRPSINIVQPVAGDISSYKQIDWIREENVNINFSTNKEDSGNRKLRVLLLGGCDLEQMCHYLDNRKFDIVKEFNYPNSQGYAVHREHTQLLRIAQNCSELEKKEIGTVPFCDEHMFETILFSGNYDVLVYSVLMNYTQDVVKHQSGKWSLSYGGYTGSTEGFLENLYLNDEERTHFLNEYSFIGQQSKEDFVNDLEWLVNIVGKKTIIFINGSEIPDFNDKEMGAYERHLVLNNALDEFVSIHDNCKILDIRNIVKSRSDCKDNLRHYQRPVYVKMAEQLMTTLSGTKMRVPIRIQLKDYLIKTKMIFLAAIFYKIYKIFK